MKIKLIYIPLLLLLMAGQCNPEKLGNDDTPMEHKYTNALKDETSPYLLQHAHNPVNWQAFSEEAFAEAEREGKLVLVSVGYSACHWCHVMEHETFEDSTAAAMMNEFFVCIKVDREERPDVDQVYMNAVQLMTKRGGWPLNCFTLADGRPIYGGTYFQKGQWMDVLQNLVDMQKNTPEKMEEYAARLTSGIQQSELIPKNEEEAVFNFSTIETMTNDWSLHWDNKEGGANRAPKFPLPNSYEYLLKYANLHQDVETMKYVHLSLDKMAQGGIYDQVGGGFARYSTDELWKAPHFEKMLYDNAQLVSLYSEAYTESKKEEYKEVVYETLAFIKRELTSDEGAFYSALDADSEGEEGKFYVWKKDELDSLLGDLYPFAEKYYNINHHGRWEHSNYILLRRKSDEDFASDNKMVIEEVKAKAKQIDEILMGERDGRIRPGLDDKTLTSWNALMIKGYADAYRAFGEDDFLQTARKNANLIWDTQRNKDGSLNHSYKEGRSTINGYLEDYSFTIEAFIALYEVTFDEMWLKKAKELADYAIAHFHDENSGMFWFTSDIDPPLIARKQESMDNVIPASNSSMSKGLFLLGTYYYKKEYMDMSVQMLNNIQQDMNYGQNFSNWGILMLWNTKPFYEVAITGENSEELRKEFNAHYIPNKILLGGKNKSNLPLLEGKFIGESTIFVCQDRSCQLPVNTVDEALVQIK